MSRVRACIVLGFLAIASACQASVLNDTIQHYPWVEASGGHVTYDAATGAFDIVECYPEMFNKDASPMGGINLPAWTSSLFELHVIIDPVAKTVSANTAYPWALYVARGWDNSAPGDIFEDPNGEIFHSSRPVEFDFNLSNQGQVAFRFRQDGQTRYADGTELVPDNANVVIQLWTANFPADLSASFDSWYDDGVGVAMADIFYLPEPASLSVLALGALLLRKNRR